MCYYNLEKDGYASSFVSKENLTKAKQAFGPMLRELGKETPRMKMKPDSLKPVKMEEMTPKFFNEGALKDYGYLFYTEDSSKTLPKEQAAILSGHLADKENYNALKDSFSRQGISEDRIRYLVRNLIEIDKDKFKTPLNFIFVSYEPEYRFTQALFNHVELFDSVFKAPDKDFYYFPYSYKPEEKVSTHVKRENFNPDFFLKLAGRNEILVVEMKEDGDTKQRNKAKYRDGGDHFNSLNDKLKEAGINWKYYFYFLSPEDITEFFEAIRDERYNKNWKSRLMQELG